MAVKKFDERIEDFKEKVDAIQKAVEELKATGIRESVLIYAIQQAANRHRTGSPVTISSVKTILLGMEDISEYLFPED